MDTPSLAESRKWIMKNLEDAADEAYAAKLDRVISGKKAIGVPVPQLRKIAREAGVQLKFTPGDWSRYLSLVVPEKNREEIIIGALGLGKASSQLDDLFGERASGWGRELDNWETTDQLSIPVGAWVYADLSRVGYLEAWTVHGETVWKKRLGIVSTVYLNHGGRSHPIETFRVVRNVMETNDPMLIKAAGWAIREIDDIEAVERFLAIWAPRCRKSLLTGAIRKLPEKNRKRIQALA